MGLALKVSWMSVAGMERGCPFHAIATKSFMKRASQAASHFPFFLMGHYPEKSIFFDAEGKDQHRLDQGQF